MKIKGLCVFLCARCGVVVVAGGRICVCVCACIDRPTIFLVLLINNKVIGNRAFVCELNFINEGSSGTADSSF